MREKWKKQNWFLGVLFLCLVMVWMLPVQTEAASTKQKALKAYRQMLAKSTINWGDTNWSVSTENCSFAIAYIDNNNVPELIICNTADTYHASGYGMLYTYRNGKAQFVDILSLNTKFYYYKKKGIYIDNYTGSGIGVNDYMRLYKGTAVSKLQRTDDMFTGAKAYYNTSNSSSFKQLSKSAFNRKLKKLVGSTKKSTIKLRNNTKYNRSKYLK